MTAVLKKLSICTCGFGLLHDHIKLGTVYQVDETERRTVTLICGGCRRLCGPFKAVYATRAGISGWLPREIFNIDEDADDGIVTKTA